MRCAAQTTVSVFGTGGFRPPSQEPAVPTTTAGTIELVAARSTRRAPGRTGASRLELLPPPRSSIPLEAVLSSKAASFPFSRGQIQATIGVRCLCRAPRPAFTRADSTIPSLGGLGCSGTMFLFFELNQPRYDENSFCSFPARMRNASPGSRRFKQPRR
jgi:hypothetical protein